MMTRRLPQGRRGVLLKAVTERVPPCRMRLNSSSVATAHAEGAIYKSEGQSETGEAATWSPAGSAVEAVQERRQPHGRRQRS